MPVAAGVISYLLYTTQGANLHMATQVRCPALFECLKRFLYLYSKLTTCFKLRAKLMDYLRYFILWSQGLAG